ncbi:MAG TPA: gamma-glutamyltransferase family protein [Thermomicrobiales bacterium]|nr:gamma-glutamyltransferase family protein [Thermomicrobiales bacterium]
MKMDLNRLEWPGRHQPVVALNGMVATSQPLAAQAGLLMLRNGGNAVDAALATVSTLTVVEPGSTSIGGDAFALIWDGSALHGINGSGRAPTGLTIDEVHRRGHDAIPDHGWLPVTIPGAPAVWRDVHQRFGKLPFEEVLKPAITYAEKGYPASPISVWSWRKQVLRAHESLEGPEFAHFMDLYAPGGHSPNIGDIWHNRDKANTLRRIAETYAEAFYAGDIAEKIVDFAQATDGYITAEDMASHRSEWVDPIGTNYRGYDVWEIPPNGQGIATLGALNILEGFDLTDLPRNSAESYHLQIEAMKLAFADAQRYVGDPQHVDIPVAGMISKPYADERRQLIGEMALQPEPGLPPRSDTVYLCTADGDGMMVSFIQSAYKGFGSHVVAPGTGFSLQNRGHGFSLDPDHPNALAPGRRPFHTIIPGFLTHEGEAVGPFGVMGGHMQPQGHVQMVVNTIDYGMDPQTSIEQPRWQWTKDRNVLLETGTDPEIVEALRSRGHEIELMEDLGGFGRGQIIWKLPSGALMGGSESRADGQAVGY